MEESCCGGGGSCGCGGFERKHFTADEEAEWLKGYKKELEQELEAVNEKISVLHKKK